MTATVSARLSASSWSWVTMMVVMPEFLVELLELPAQVDPDPGVQGRQGLVQEQQAGAGGQGPGQRHPLLLAAGELAREFALRCR